MLGGLDKVLHGSDELRGWGQWLRPIRRCSWCAVSTAREVSYSVNPLFGSSAVYRSAFRAPFALTIDFKIEVGPDRESKLIRGGLGRAWVSRRTRFGGGGEGEIDRSINPFRAITALRDSLN